ncbi:MAG: CHAP domain-containing protein [Novosphingobium sp.]
MIERLVGGARRWLACNLAAAAILTGLALAPAPAEARGVLQCVPYARSVSGIEIRGNAHTWWNQAEGVYARGHEPRAGAVLAFRASGAMPLGHVAMVSRVLDDRRVLLNHANWSRPGMVERAALAEDVSAAGDWSEVRVWYAPTASLGLRVSPAYGFIYADKPADEAPALQGPVQLASRGTSAFRAAFADIQAPL